MIAEWGLRGILGALGGSELLDRTTECGGLREDEEGDEEVWKER